MTVSAKVSIGTVISGNSSYYGARHHGNRTASGERFNMNGLTAAHKTLPLGTVIRVTNKDNGKSVTLTVNDRGPYHGNRVLDVSQGAAKRLDFIKQGVAKVSIVVLSLPKKKVVNDDGIKRVSSSSRYVDEPSAASIVHYSGIDDQVKPIEELYTGDTLAALIFSLHGTAIK